VTNYTKAGGACGKCHDDIRELIKKVFEEAEIEAEKETKPTEFDSFTNIEKIKRIDAFIAEKIRPTLQRDGGDLELVDFSDNTVSLRLKGACQGCIGAASTMKDFIEKKIKENLSPKLKVKAV